MSFESRLRQGLDSAAGPTADVEGALVAVRSRHRRRVRGRRTAAALTSVLAVVSLTLGAPTVLERWQDPRGLEEPPPAATTAESLVGTYVVDIEASPAAERDGMAGRWTVRLQEGGAVEMVPPGRFRGTASGSSYRAEADVVRVDAFLSDVLCESAQVTEPVGSYQWTRTSDTLVFVAVSDACAARRLLFAGQPWKVVR
jgi:hypothetical protein